MPQKADVSEFKEKEKEIDLIHVAIITAKGVIKHQ